MPATREQLASVARYIAHLLSSLHRETEPRELPCEITYKAVFQLAQAHSLAGTVWYALEARVGEIDEKLASAWRHQRDTEIAKNINQYREFSHITQAFADNGIPFLPMKGFIFKELWRRPEYRTMSDIDVYVSPKDVERAGALLLDLGYSRSIEGDVHESFEKKPYINVELHRTTERGSEDSFDEWHARVDNPMWYVMSDEDCFIFHISHMYKHFTSGGSGMRTFFDLYLYTRAKQLDMEYVEKELSNRGMLDFYGKAVRLSELWFSECEAEADEELLEFEHYIITGGAYGTVENRVDNAVRGKSTFAYYWQRAFLPYSQMIYIYRWLPKVPFLLPVAWVMRWFSALFSGKLSREVKAIDKAKGKNNENRNGRISRKNN